MFNKNLLIKPNATIKYVLKQFTKLGKGCLIVVNKKNKLLGTITDGDIRRFILKGMLLKDEINDIYKKKPIYFLKFRHTTILQRKFLTI